MEREEIPNWNNSSQIRLVACQRNIKSYTKLICSILSPQQRTATSKLVSFVEVNHCCRHASLFKAFTHTLFLYFKNKCISVHNTCITFMTRDIHLSIFLKCNPNLNNTNFVQKKADKLRRKTLRGHIFLCIINFTFTFRLIIITSVITTKNWIDIFDEPHLQLVSTDNYSTDIFAAMSTNISCQLWNNRKTSPMW